MVLKTKAFSYIYDIFRILYSIEEEEKEGRKYENELFIKRETNMSGNDHFIKKGNMRKDEN